HHLLGVLARQRAHPLHPFGVRRPRLFAHATQYWPRSSSGLADTSPIAQSTPVERIDRTLTGLLSVSAESLAAQDRSNFQR
ncbi:MAG: hypothetical protein WAK44_16320, partial [Trebonia sp.]|uniref:hypothetical protein n=1 Tax=Trebonia sp. TaxID=2767075 RepID=UPI003BAFF516